MYQYRNDPLYPHADPVPAAVEAAMQRGRKLRAQAFAQLVNRGAGVLSSRPGRQDRIPHGVARIGTGQMA